MRDQRASKRKGRIRGSGPGSRCRGIKVCGRKRKSLREDQQNETLSITVIRRVACLLSSPFSPDYLYLFTTSGSAPLIGFLIPPRTCHTRDRCRSNSTRPGMVFTSFRSGPPLLFSSSSFCSSSRSSPIFSLPHLGLKGPYQPSLLSTSTNPICIFVVRRLVDRKKKTSGRVG